jgi:hypothetical protein
MRGNISSSWINLRKATAIAAILNAAHVQTDEPRGAIFLQ